MKIQFFSDRLPACPVGPAAFVGAFEEIPVPPGSGAGRRNVCRFLKQRKRNSEGDFIFHRRRDFLLNHVVKRGFELNASEQFRRQPFVVDESAWNPVPVADVVAQKCSDAIHFKVQVTIAGFRRDQKFNAAVVADEIVRMCPPCEHITITDVKFQVQGIVGIQQPELSCRMMRRTPCMEPVDFSRGSRSPFRRVKGTAQFRRLLHMDNRVDHGISFSFPDYGAI